MYTYTWKKYLPVIRILLKRSSVGEQQMKLDRIDFEKNNRIRKPLCSFAIELEKGRLIMPHQSVPAKDLLDTLMQDDASRTLLRAHHYAISLSSDFQLSIRNCTPVTEQAAEPLPIPGAGIPDEKALS